MASKARDRWAEWLLERRQGGDPEAYRRMLEQLRPVRDRVLDGARIRDGDVVLDVGTGDGLIALGALDRVGAQGAVVFSDVSQDCLDHCRSLVENDARARFVRAAAEDLSAVAGESVDAVTTRSVVIYLPFEDKRRAFREFFRVLRAGGRVSMFEPINRFGMDECTRDDQLMGLDTAAVADLAAKVRALYDAKAPGERTLVDFDERDLVAFAQDAGFAEIELDYEVKVVHGAAFAWAAGSTSVSWDTFVNSSGNPHAPTLAEVLEEALSPEERERFVAHVRPAFEERRGVSYTAVAYLRALKR